MTRFFFLLLALIASPVAAQTITVAKPFADNNGDGRIDFGTANQKAYGVFYVTLAGQQEGQWVYCGPKGCDAPKIASASAEKPRTLPTCLDKGSSGQWTYGTAGGSYGPACLTRTMDTVPFRASSDAPRLFQDVTVKASRNFMTTRMKSGYAKISNLTARRMDITVRERGFYIRGGSHGWLIEDVTIRCAGAAEYPAGVAIGAAGSVPTYNITIRRAEISDCISTKDGYQQGDGISSERPDYGISILDSYIHDIGDGCLDLKSSKTVIRNVRLARCNYGLRAWAEVDVDGIAFEGVRKADIQMKSSTNAVIRNVTTDRPFIYVEVNQAGGRLVIDGCAKPVKLSGANANVTLGKGCLAVGL